MAGTPAVNPIGDIITPPPPPVGSVEAEIAQLHSMGLHHLANMLGATHTTSTTETHGSKK